jgi:hypothetical protein
MLCIDDIHRQFQLLNQLSAKLRLFPCDFSEVLFLVEVFRRCVTDEPARRLRGELDLGIFEVFFELFVAEFELARPVLSWPTILPNSSPFSVLTTTRVGTEGSCVSLCSNRPRIRIRPYRTSIYFFILGGFGFVVVSVIAI